MSIISQNNTKSELSNSISSFFSKYHIGNLLRKCNANKEKGVPVIRIFMYKLCNVFKKASMYMQMKTDSYHESFSKNTYYRFLNSAKTNWLRFTSLLSKAVANTIEPLTSDDRINAFVIDDSLFERTSGRHTELASKVFDHCSMKFKTGYRLMTLGWTDGNTFLPVNSTLLASSKACNQYCQERSSYDYRFLFILSPIYSRIPGSVQSDVIPLQKLLHHYLYFLRIYRTAITKATGNTIPAKTPACRSFAAF